MWGRLITCGRLPIGPVGLMRILTTENYLLSWRLSIGADFLTSMSSVSQSFSLGGCMAVCQQIAAFPRRVLTGRHLLPWIAYLITPPWVHFSCEKPKSPR